MSVTEQIVREAPEIEAYKLGLLQDARALADQPITLPVQQVAEQSGLQQQAAQLAAQGIGSFTPYLEQAGYTMGDALRAIQPGAVTEYMNPYQDAVQAEINRAFDIQQDQAAGQAVGAGAFGGSRAQVAQSEIDRNRAAALAQSQAQNFLQAQRAAQTAAEQLGTLGLRQASLGQLGQQLGQQDAQFAFDMGQRQQAQQQAELEAQRQSDLAQLYEPYQRYAFLSDIYKGAPSTQQTIASSTAPSVSPAQQYLGLGIAGLSAAAGAERAGLFG
tara:strand:- start:149 stop:967 length:819 start_codon:yes stop_codon:yes gene_type:complete